METVKSRQLTWVVNRPRAGRTGLALRFPVGLMEIYLFFKALQPALGPTPHPIDWVRGGSITTRKEFEA